MPQIQDPRSLAYTPGATAEDSGIPLWLRPVSNWWEEQQRRLREWQQQQYEMEMERARIAQNVGQSNLDYLNSGQNPAKPPQSPVTIAANAFGENIYSSYSPTGKGTIVPYTTPDGTFVPRDVLGAERFNRPQPTIPYSAPSPVEDFLHYDPRMKPAPWVAPEDRGLWTKPLYDLQKNISGPIAQISPEGTRLAELSRRQNPESDQSQALLDSEQAVMAARVESKESARVLQGFLSSEDEAAQNRRFGGFLGPQNTLADNAQTLWDTASTVAPIVSGQMPGAAKAIAETQGPLAATLTNFLGIGMPDEQAAAKGVIHLAGEFIAKQGKKALGINPVGKTLIKLLQTPGYTLERALSETFESHPDATVSDVARVLHVTDADSLNYIDAFKNVSTWDETRRAGQGVPSAAEIIARQTPPTQTAPTGVVPPVVPPTATGAQLIPENRPSWATRGKGQMSSLVPEQPEPPAGRYTRQPMGRPPWEEGPVAAAAQAPAPEPPVGATTLPQQNAPLEAPQRPLPPPGGRTVPPTPETAPSAPGMKPLTHYKKVNDDYNGMFGDVPEYEVTNMERETAKAVDAVTADLEASYRGFMNGSIPSDVNATKLGLALENALIEGNDMERASTVLSKLARDVNAKGVDISAMRGAYSQTSPQAVAGRVIAGRLDEVGSNLPHVPPAEVIAGTADTGAARVRREMTRQTGELRRSISSARVIDLQQANALLSTWTCRPARA